MQLRLPAGSNTARLTIGMHYDDSWAASPCRGLIEVNGHPVFNSNQMHSKDVLTFNYSPGDVLARAPQPGGRLGGF